MYAACTGRDVSPDAAGGCPASPSDNVSVPLQSSARCGPRLQRLTTGSPPSCLAYWSCRARLGVFGSGADLLVTASPVTGGTPHGV